MIEQTVLKIDPALPCAIRKPTDENPDARCGQPATVAHSYPAADDAPDVMVPGLARPGEWIISPVCRACAEELSKLYIPIEGDPDDRT